MDENTKIAIEVCKEWLARENRRSYCPDMMEKNDCLDIGCDGVNSETWGPICELVTMESLEWKFCDFDADTNWIGVCPCALWGTEKVTRFVKEFIKKHEVIE